MAKRKYDDDDGRVIAEMDLPGMPYNTGLRGWLRKKRLESVSFGANSLEANSLGAEKPGGAENPGTEAEGQASVSGSAPVHPAPDREEVRIMVRGAILAALAVAAIFGGAGALFIAYFYLWK